jgi:hypothetical protein
MKPRVSLAQAMCDPKLFGRTFAAPSFWPWHAVAKVLGGEPLDSREAELFFQCTGRSRLPTKPVGRIFLLVGRRGGKDRFASAAATHQAALAADWREMLSDGEQAVVIMLGVDRKQARILRRYCGGLLAGPLLAAEVVRDTDEMVEFRNGAALEISTNDVSLVRGRSAIAIIGTECCHWTTDDARASSDEEVVAAAEPAMAMTPGGGLLLMQSSVYRQAGFMYRQFKELHGNDDADAICWLAPSATMNPALPAKVVEDALSRDLARAQAEFNSVWRSDLAAYLSREIVEAAVDRGVFVRPPRAGVSYVAYVDAASGAGKDSYAVAIAHADGDEVIIDCAHEIRPSFNPQEATREVCELVKSYRVTEVRGDKYAAGFVVESHAKNGIKYEYAENDTSRNYIEALNLFMSGRVRLVDNQRLVTQFVGLERRTSISGIDRVSHGIGDHHDDISAAVAGVMTLASAANKYLDYELWIGEPKGFDRMPYFARMIGGLQ